MRSRTGPQCSSHKRSASTAVHVQELLDRDDDGVSRRQYEQRSVFVTISVGIEQVYDQWEIHA